MIRCLIPICSDICSIQLKSRCLIKDLHALCQAAHDCREVDACAVPMEVESVVLHLDALKALNLDRDAYPMVVDNGVVKRAALKVLNRMANAKPMVVVNAAAKLDVTSQVSWEGIAVHMAVVSIVKLNLATNGLSRWDIVLNI